MYTYPMLSHLEELSFATLHPYRTKTPPGVRDQLIALSGWMEIYDPSWVGWRVQQGTLWTNTGLAVTAGEINALPWLWAIRAEVMRKERSTIVRPMVGATLRQTS